MNIVALETVRVLAGKKNILQIIDEALPALQENCIIAVTSKIVSICEGSLVAAESISKEDLILKEADLYLDASLSKYGHHFTITNNTLIPTAGIDESNGEGYYILWPKDAQKTANEIRQHLLIKHGVKNVGVVVTDSTCQPSKIGRMLKRSSGVCVTIDIPIEPPAAMLHVQRQRGFDDRKAYGKWHMGPGMVVATTEPQKVIEVAAEHNVRAQVIGQITDQPGIRILNRGANLDHQGEERLVC